jgi:hypothetical protein
MKITKAQPDKNGVITIINVVRLLTMGLQNNVVTIWAVTDSLGTPGVERLPIMRFHVKKGDAPVTPTDCKHYVTSFINEKSVFHLFGEEMKVSMESLPTNFRSNQPTKGDPNW